MKLYMISRCPFAHRAAFALGEKGLTFEPVFYNGQARPKELDAVSKNAKSPTLFDGHDAVYESAVVLEYLEDRFPARPLMPVAAKARADVRVTIARVNEELGSKFGAIAGEALKPTPDDLAIAEASRPFLEALTPWDARLADKTFLVGDTLSLADITLYTIFPALEHLAKVTIPAELVHLRGWRDRLAARPAAVVPAST